MNKEVSPDFLVIDHYDSFTDNLVDLLYRSSPASTLDCVSYDDPLLQSFIEQKIQDQLQPSHLCVVFSPGPNSPDEVPASLRVYREFKKPLLFFRNLFGASADRCV